MPGRKRRKVDGARVLKLGQASLEQLVGSGYSKQELLRFGYSPQSIERAIQRIREHGQK